MGTTITGATELDKTFLALPGATRRKVIMPSLRQGGAVVRELAIANLKGILSDKSTGVLIRNIRVINKKKTRGYYGVMVSVKRGVMNTKVKGQPVRVGLYASVLEYGKRGQAPRSWIRKAVREGVEPSLSEMRKVFRLKIYDAIREAKK